MKRTRRHHPLRPRTRVASGRPPRAAGPTTRSRAARGRTAKSARRSPATRAARPAAGAFDGGVLTATLLLAAIGAVMIYSTTAALEMGSALPQHFLRHLVGVCLAFGAAMLGLRLPVVSWRRIAWPLWATSLALLVLTLLMGISANGARRWLALPGLPVSLQAAEIARFAVLVGTAAVFARARAESLPALRSALVLAGVPAVLLVFQPDFGSAALLALGAGAVCFGAGVPLRRLAALAGAGIGVAGAYALARPYALARWKGFLDPWANAHTEGFQLVQSYVAFARGGWFGVGIGNGRQKLSYLPEAHTDFILSVCAEELGLLGVLLVLGAFAALVLAGMRIAANARDPFARLLAFGLTCGLALPAAVNAAVVMGCLPTTGFALPFVSFGTNSLLVCALAVGVLLRIGAESAPTRRAA